MFAFLQLSTGSIFGFLCVVAGFLVIVASVVFVIKGKAVLGDSGAPNAVEWGKIKTSLTSAVALFVLGAAMIVVPFWLVQTEEAQQRAEQARLLAERAREPATAILTGQINGRSGRDVRLLLVAKPDYDQTYRGDILWRVPLLAKPASYAVLYLDGDTILGQQNFSVEAAAPGTAPQKFALPVLDLQTDSSGPQEIHPVLEVSDAEVKKSLAIR